MNTLHDKEVRDHLRKLLDGKQAHLDIHAAVKDFPPELHAKKPTGAPHTAWQLLEHIRITQADILNFCVNPNYKNMAWPDDYWPKNDRPPSEQDWKKSIDEIAKDLSAIKKIVADEKTDLFAKIEHGDGQSILREAMLVADHSSYHLGQLVYLRKTLEAAR